MKIIKPIFIVALFYSSFISAKNIHEDSELTKWPTCIAEFCFDKSAPREIELIQLYGEGILKHDNEDSYRCYKLTNQKIYLKFTIHNDEPKLIDEILVSDQNICHENLKETKLLKKIKTSEGLAIGDNYKKTIVLYGHPKYLRTGKDLKILIRDELSLDEKLINTDSAIAYGPNVNDDLLVTWIFLKKNRVTAILMSISE